MSAKLDHYDSQFVSISLSDFGPLSPGYPRINYKQLLDSLRPAPLPTVLPPNESKPQTSSETHFLSQSGRDDDLGEEGPLADSSIPPELLSKSSKRNRHENIIEILEKKYCGATVGNGAESSEEEEEEVKNRTTKRKKRDTTTDYYDMDDPFIDDSDNIASFESQLKMKTIQTKHSGYFVSSGVLEVNDTRSFSKISENQQQNAIDTINQAHPSIALAFKGLVVQSKEIQETITKSFPSVILSGFISLDSLALSSDLDIFRLATKSKSPYRVCIDYILQQLFSKSDGQEIAEEQMETSFQSLKKQVLKQRSNQSSGAISNSSRLRKVIDEKIPEIAEKIKSKIEPNSSADGQKESGGCDLFLFSDSLSTGTNEEPSNCQWICKWDMKLRGEIFAIEQLCRQWVEIENLGRGGSSPSPSTNDKKKKLPSEELLSLNAEITKVFTQLSTLAFSSPYSETSVEKGGVMGIRKALTTEKIRVKNREKKLFSQFTPPTHNSIEFSESSAPSSRPTATPQHSQLPAELGSFESPVGPKPNEGQGQKKEKKRITPVPVASVSAIDIA